MKLLNRRKSPKYSSCVKPVIKKQPDVSPSESQFIFITTDIDQVQEQEIDDNFVIKRESMREMHCFT